MGQSHATGKSVVPEGIQKLAPEALERALPDTSVSSFPPLRKNIILTLGFRYMTPMSAESTYLRGKPRSTFRRICVDHPLL